MSIIRSLSVSVLYFSFLGVTPSTGNAQISDSAKETADTIPARHDTFEQIDFNSLDTTGLFSPKPVSIKGYMLKAKQGGKAPTRRLEPGLQWLAVAE